MEIQFLKCLFVLDGQILMKLGDCVIQYNQNFRLYITTKMGNPHYAPEVTTKTTIVNFAVKQEGNVSIFCFVLAVACIERRWKISGCFFQYE
jgi:ubiquitin-protein ligase